MTPPLAPRSPRELREAGAAQCAHRRVVPRPLAVGEPDLKQRGKNKISWFSIIWVHSSVVRAADCRSAGPWFKSGCALSPFLCAPPGARDMLCCNSPCIPEVKRAWAQCCKPCIHFSVSACHPCAGVMLNFSVSFRFVEVIPERSPQRMCGGETALPGLFFFRSEMFFFKSEFARVRKSDFCHSGVFFATGTALSVKSFFSL